VRRRALRVRRQARVQEIDMKEWGLYLWLEDSRRGDMRAGRASGATPWPLRCIPPLLAALGACALGMLML